MKTKLAVHGASGRMGQEVLRLADQFAEIEIIAALVSSKSKVLGSAAGSGHLQKLTFSCDLANQIKLCDVVLDFSSPQACLQMLLMAAEYKKPVMIGTTGFSEPELAKLQEHSKHIPILLAPNFSLGLNVLRKLADQAFNMLGPDYEVEVLEIHHSAKKDAPSGSAMKIAAGLKQLRPELEVVTDRAQRQSARLRNEIGVSSLRGGAVYGEHSIFFFGPEERLELCHQVSTRAVFARGALKLSTAIISKSPGLYDILDLL